MDSCHIPCISVGTWKSYSKHIGRNFPCLIKLQVPSITISVWVPFMGFFEFYNKCSVHVLNWIGRYTHAKKLRPSRNVYSWSMTIGFSLLMTNFSFYRQIKEQGIPFSMKGSPLWMAPEVIVVLKYSPWCFCMFGYAGIGLVVLSPWELNTFTPFSIIRSVLKMLTLTLIKRLWTHLSLSIFRVLHNVNFISEKGCFQFEDKL